MDHPDATHLRAGREELVRHALRLLDDGLAIGTAGNLSLRLGDTVLITPSGVSYRDLTPADICPVALIPASAHSASAHSASAHSASAHSASAGPASAGPASAPFRAAGSDADDPPTADADGPLTAAASAPASAPAPAGPARTGPAPAGPAEARPSLAQAAPAGAADVGGSLAAVAPASPASASPAPVTPVDPTEANSPLFVAAPVPAEASSELPLHLAVYRATDATAIVHTHSPEVVALSAVRDDLPAIHYAITALGGPVRVARYERFGSHHLAQSAVAALDGRRAVILRNHGAVSYGNTLPQAYDRALLLEWLAHVYRMACSLGTPHILTADDLIEVAAEMRRRHYGEPQ